MLYRLFVRCWGVRLCVVCMYVCFMNVLYCVLCVVWVLMYIDVLLSCVFGLCVLYCFDCVECGH